jgi:TRAP-type C4-dicarboxylate transport system substrate-binding protein
VLKYHTTAYRAGSGYTFYVLFNKNKWNSLPPEAQKVFTELAEQYIEPWAIEWNKTDIDGREFFYKNGGKTIVIADAEIQRWVKAVEPVIDNYKKDMVSKGFKAEEVDSWISFIKERIEHWKNQEKIRKIPTAYKY